MLSIVNYGSSDSENEITDEEETAPIVSNKQNGEKQEIEEIKLKLPPASRQSVIIEEADDEFLLKKEIPDSKPPAKPKQRVKITIPKLSDFKEDDDDDLSSRKKFPSAANRKTGLLGMLPKPSTYIGPAPKPQAPITQKPPSTVTSMPVKLHEQSSTSTSSDLQPKKIGLIPYSLMDHKKAADLIKETKKKDNDSDSDEEGAPSSFFTFSSGHDDLPQVSEEEIKSLIAKETNRLEQRKRQNEGIEDNPSPQQEYNQYYQPEEQPDVDKEALSALMGGNKAKRSKLEGIQIVDLSHDEVLPNREEWMRKTLAGETGYVPTGSIDEKGPNVLAKRKHQLSYLSVRAEKNMAELEAMWAANRQNNREARSKYGF